MPYENTAGLSVNNHYGQRTTGFAIGKETGSDSTFKLSIDLTGEMLNSAFMPPVVVPAGALVTSAYLDIDEAFVVSTGGTVAIGGTAPGTNGVVLTKAQLEAVGTKPVTAGAVGTWAANSTTGTTAAQRVAKAVTGTVGATSGKGTLVVEFFFKSKAA